jgi:thymidylate kinase
MSKHRMVYPGRLIVLEGPDGVGKTAIAGGLCSYLESRHIRCKSFSFPGKEEGTLGGLVYSLHHADSPAGESRPDATALQLAHVAAHIDIIERQIRPALREGSCVVLDRYWWSTKVYGMVGGAESWSVDAMLRIERHHWRGIRKPTVILLRRNQADRPRIPHADQINAKYDQLFAEETKRRRSPTVVDNNGSIDEAVATVAQLTEQLWHPLVRTQRRLRESRIVQLSLSFDMNPTPSSEHKPPAAVTAAPTIATRLSPPKPTAVYDTYWRFATERQAIFFRRLEQCPPPWTTDEVLQDHRFTNAYRASDRVSQYLIRHIIRIPAENPDDLLFRILLFKIFNKIDTWRLLEAKLGAIRWADFSLDRYDAVLDKAFASGVRIYSAAYIMPSGGPSSNVGRKHSMHLQLIKRMIRDNLAGQLAEAKSMEAAFNILLQYPSIGNFLAYQLITDINYSELTPFKESEFVMPGPGARDGIRKCFSDLGGFDEQGIIKLMTDRQEYEFERLGLNFQSLWGRKLHLIDCQNLFCEVDKYARVKHPEISGISGRTRIKQRYSIDPSPIDPVYPRKYELDAAIEQWRAHVSSI